jgi:acetyl esterase/lipase
MIGAMMTHSDAEILAEDTSYHQTSAGPLLARLYRRRDGSHQPAVVSVHGGRWTTQSRLTNEVIDRALAAAGIVVMAVDFRMPPAVRYPVPVAEINLAIRWLKRHAAEFGAAADLVGGIGTSSGGHQIMLNALRPHDPRYRALELADASGIDAELGYVVACWPVLDPLARYRMAKARSMEVHVQAHDAYWPDEAAMGEGNPQLILERGETVGMPPLLLIQGTGDIIVPPEMTDRFADVYRSRGGEVTLEKFDGQPHTFITNTPAAPASIAAIRSIGQFILRKAG